jgi:chromosome segregation ATPase
MSVLCTSYPPHAIQTPVFIPKNIFSTLEKTKEKIRDFFPKMISALLSGQFFSSKEFYEIAEVTLICSSFIGLIGSFGLIITGMPGTSFLVLALSITTTVGAYIANQASLQQTLIESANQMEKQIEIFGGENKTLKHIVSEFSIKMSQFDLQLEHLKTISQHYQKNPEALTKKIGDFLNQIESFEILWDRILKENKHLQGNMATQITDLKKIIQEITDPRSTLLRLEEHQKIREQINEDLACLKKIKQEIEEMNRQIALRDSQLKERDELLIQLRKDHYEILSSYKGELKEVIPSIRNNVTSKLIESS